jgi:hypothetical protein
MACALRQFLKLTPKDVVELQLLRYFPRNMKAVRAPGIKVRLLQQQDVRFAAAQKLDDPRQLQSAIDVPAHHLERVQRAKEPPWTGEVACFDLRFKIHHICRASQHTFNSTRLSFLSDPLAFVSARTGLPRNGILRTTSK